jgi:hypothetical protein
MAPSSLPALRSRYDLDGFVRLSWVLPVSRREALVAALVEGLGPAPWKNPYGVLRHNVWRELRAYRDELLGGELAEQVCALVGHDLVLFQDNLIWKPPRTEHEVSWHQDYSYWPLSAPEGVTVWLALDGADVENGCLHYIAGTHREGERCPTDFVPGSKQPLRGDLLPLDPTGRPEAAAPVPAGAVLAHHPLTWHRSPPNLTDRDRRAWSLTFVVPSVRWDPPHAPHPFNWSLAPTSGATLEGELFPRFSAGR